ncbi:hypothetical protein AB5J56_39715 [Streptomyces sp. R21]|uniref:Septum formation-related domain-containing protein n=1 Tax=Streptomyces sp. R21 TaxID=3238627 RepID=A0AB39PHF3_9ACTN
MIVAVGVVVAVVLVTTRGDGSPGDKKSPSASSASTKGSPTPSLSIPSELPSVTPTLPSEVPSGVPSDLQSLFPSLASDQIPYYTLKSGDCFDTDDKRPGQATKRSCTKPHDAEVVKVTELQGSYTTDAALKKAASALCEKPLNRKAAKQPSATVRGTLVQYPDSTGYKIGIDNVACSLSGDVGAGDHKLTKPLT